jgi:hypothetical protein
LENAAYVKQVAGYTGNFRVITYFLAFGSTGMYSLQLWDSSKTHPLTFHNWFSLLGCLLPQIAYSGALVGIGKAKVASVLTAEAGGFCKGLVTQLTMTAYLALIVILGTH